MKLWQQDQWTGDQRTRDWPENQGARESSLVIFYVWTKFTQVHPVWDELAGSKLEQGGMAVVLMFMPPLEARARGVTFPHQSGPVSFQNT